MKRPHVKKDFEAWYERRTQGDERQAIEGHLAECAKCRSYYRRMSQLFEAARPVLLPRIEPDPFLPARIRALAEDRANERAVAAGRATVAPAGGARRLAAPVMTAAAVLAAVLGVFIGRELSLRAPVGQSVDAAMVDTYYDAFSQPAFGNEWEEVVGTEEENGS
jgi:predicted anti-sigma-YlaC factor YlaD